MTGLLLIDAQRFDRHGYLRDRQEQKQVIREKYWKEIPGENLYISAERLTTLNIHYEAVQEVLKAEVEEGIAEALGAKVIVDLLHQEMGIEPGEKIKIGQLMAKKTRDKRRPKPHQSQQPPSQS